MSSPSDPKDTLPDKTQQVATHPFEASATVESASLVPDPAETLADEEVPKGPPEPVPAYQATSEELSRSSRRARRRERDGRAERRAIQVLIGVFVGLGGLALVAVNVFLDDPEPTAPPPPAEADQDTEAPAVPPPPSVPPKPENVISTPTVETVDIPALRQLKNEGLTIAAEGLPEVVASVQGSKVNVLAARETCRFAYGIWEFSPNKRFRFLPTCPSMDGQVLFGAYAISGGTIRMSPLTVSGVELVSEFRVERPSRVMTRVSVDGGRYTLRVSQRVTVIRAGQMGDAFFNSYADKNTLRVPGRSARRPPPSEPAPPPPKRDRLLELLKNTKR